MNSSSLTKTILITTLFVVFILSAFVISAQENLEEICQWEKIKDKPENLSEEDYELLLRKCQTYYEDKSKEIEKDITKTEQEKKSLSNQIYLLSNKIKNLDYQIYQGNIMIKDLSSQIQDTQSSIDTTTLRIEEIKEKLADILQLRYEEDQTSLVEIFLVEENLSDFFDNLMALESLNLKTQGLLADIKGLKSSLEDQKGKMVTEKEDLENVVTVQTLQKEESAKTRGEQEYFLKLTETEYQKYLQEKELTEKKAADIRAKIYELIGVRKAVTYEEALEVAKYAASQVGIRPALLLGILSQESAIGRNVGQCYLKNPSSGEGVIAFNGTKISRVMNPTRDVPYFLQIIEDLNKINGLNLDPFETLVSCPMSFGWGGAMGPAQFIPDTWANPNYGYKKRVEGVTGRAADPWDLRDASLAASFYLKDGLARYGTEDKAIQSYFCGYPKGDYWCSWYSRNVLYLARCHQNFIDGGAMSSECQEAVGLK